MKKILLILLFIPSISFAQNKIPHHKYLIETIEKNMEGTTVIECEKLKLKTENDGVINHIIKIDNNNFQVLAEINHYCEDDQYRNYVMKTEILAFFKFENGVCMIYKIMDPHERFYYMNESKIKN